MRNLWSDFLFAFANLKAQKTRTFLTALGIVFGVGSVIGMLSIGAGAREELLRFIEQLGVRNVLIESRAATSQEELQERRKSSPGLTERDVRILEANIETLEFISPRKSLRPAQVLPKPAREVPTVYGVRPDFAKIHSLKLVEGRFFDATEEESAAPVCILGETAKVSILGYGYGVGKHVKVNDNWMEVIGVIGNIASGASRSQAGKMEDQNNAIYIPFSAVQYRYWDRSSFMKDDLDGVDIRLKPEADSVETAKVVTSVLQSTHRGVEDYSVTIPAALLAQQKQQQRIFTYVMVAIAAISLLVGGIGIMNIVLATVLERTREIGIRRATGARRTDIVRQFLTESVLISVGGGALGVAFGVFLSWLIAQTAEWRTIVTTASVVIAFTVSVAVGVLFGIYPAVKASRINPIEALRYE